MNDSAREREKYISWTVGYYLLKPQLIPLLSKFDYTPRRLRYSYTCRKLREASIGCNEFFCFLMYNIDLSILSWDSVHRRILIKWNYVTRVKVIEYWNWRFIHFAGNNYYRYTFWSRRSVIFVALVHCALRVINMTGNLIFETVHPFLVRNVARSVQ